MNAVRKTAWSRIVHFSFAPVPTFVYRPASSVTDSELPLCVDHGKGKKPAVPSNIVVLGVDKDRRAEIRPALKSFEDLEIVRRVKGCQKHRKPGIIQLDSLKTDFSPTSAIELHPDVFACNPRIDFIYLCKEWQRKYREVDYSWKPTRSEVGRGRKKPWPQKSGLARHGSRVAPQWKGGGVAHGPRGPKPLYQKILPHVRLRALTSMLTIKFYQQDLSVVDNLDISSPEADNLREILVERGLSGSSMIVHSEADAVEEQSNICTATEHWPDTNLFPVVGLNVWSLLQHDKLILTINALEEIETKIVWNLHRYDWIDKPHNFYRDLPFKIDQ